MLRFLSSKIHPISLGSYLGTSLIIGNLIIIRVYYTNIRYLVRLTIRSYMFLYLSIIDVLSKASK